MADTDATTMTDADVTAAASTHVAEPNKGSTTETGTFAAKKEEAKQAIKDNASKYGDQATDKVRSLADTGKAKATGALTQVSKLIDDAAGQVDERLGSQYGDYARTAAGQISTFSSQIESKDVEELLDEARAFVRKSPAVAVGVAAAVGFALARVIQSGVDSNKA
ncbi:MAG: hypothetical protein OSB00_03455 [Sphingomonas bacterium]|nr:hypothetical protein [Sphingomonas bacterium]